jgi:hypothetical protein
LAWPQSGSSFWFVQLLHHPQWRRAGLSFAQESGQSARLGRDSSAGSPGFYCLEATLVSEPAGWMVFDERRFAEQRGVVWIGFIMKQKLDLKRIAHTVNQRLHLPYW